MIKRFRQWGPVFFWCGLIFWFSSMPSVPGPEVILWDFVLKKTAHMFVYGVLFFLLCRALKPSTPKDYLKVFGLCVLYGISDEIHQSFVPGRTPTLMDVGFDSLGASLTYGVISLRS